MATKPKPFPKSLGACADLLYTLREERLAADRAAAALEEREKALVEHIIDKMPADSGGAVGLHHKAIVKRDVKPIVEDWDAFYAFVAKTKAFELLQRRLGEVAIKERWDDGTKVPGVGRMQVKKISLTKV